MRRHRARYRDTCDECGGVIEKGAPVDWQPAVHCGRGPRRHPVCPGTEDTRGLAPLRDLLLPAADLIELRGSDPDSPVPYRVSVPLRAVGGT